MDNELGEDEKEMRWEHEKEASNKMADLENDADEEMWYFIAKIGRLTAKWEICYF